MRPEDPFTGQPAEEFHHVSGRGPDGHYLDPDLVVPLTRRQHVIEHQLWRAAGIDKVKGSVRVVRLQRIANLVCRIGQGEGTITLPATFFLSLGRLLLEIVGWLA